MTFDALIYEYTKKGDFPMIKFVSRIVAVVICVTIVFFALHSIFCGLIPMVRGGVGFFEAIKLIAVSIWEGIKALFGA